MRTEQLPALNACLNTAAAVCLFAGYLCIRRKSITAHKAFMLTIWEFQKVRGGDNKSLLSTLKRMMPALELHFSEGQSNGMPYMKSAMGFWHGGNVLGRTGQ